MRWFISDTHFGHKNVIEYSQRPFKTVKQMDETMIARWNGCVGENDQVFMLGDFGLGSMLYLTDILHSLNGDKILIRGNHDGSVDKMRRMGFDAVVEEAMIFIDGYKVLLSHYPKDSESPVLRLHGHIHDLGLPYFKDGQMCVCVELWYYTPVSEFVIRKLIQKWVRDGNTCSRRTAARSRGSNDGGDEV